MRGGGRSKRWVAAIGTTLLFAVGPAHADGVTHTVTCATKGVEDSCAFDIRIDGEIVRATLNDLSLAFAAREKMMAEKGAQNDWLSIHVNSPGGSVLTAMEIGRFLRAKDAPIEIGSRETCESACIFLLAGATHRVIRGRVGIHRPYLHELPTELNLGEVQKAYTYFADRTRSYFREMNVSDRLVDEMMLIPSEQMRYLSSVQLAGYGLGMVDPVSDEYANLEKARKLGIDPPTYFQRKTLSDLVCVATGPTPGYSGYGACVEAVLSGKHVERAPPCRTRAPACPPADRDWNGRKLGRDDQVTPSGFLITGGN